MGKWKFPWVSDMFDARRITFPDKTVWELENKLSEASQQIHSPSEARVVYVCKQVEGPQVGSQAIIKVRLQWVFSLWQTSAKTKRVRQGVLSDVRCTRRT